MIVNLLSLFTTLFVLAASGAWASEPIPDTSEECLSCQVQMAQMVETWTNETTVEQILKELQEGCKVYPFVKRDICNKLAEVFVQIPPGLIEGMEDLAWPIPIAMCATIRKCSVNCCNPNDPPEQVHLSLAHSDRSIMGVSWTSFNQTASVVQYGFSEDNLQFTEYGTLDTYTAAGWVGTLHRARMVGLTEATTYYYRVGDGATSWSKVFQFRTLDSSKKSITYGIIGDMDFGEASDATVANIQALVEAGEIDIIIHSGDISYADGYEPHWDDFFNKIEPIASRVPYMVVPGNHEFWYNFTSYKHRVYMPGTIDAGGSGDNMYYSWEAGYAHFLSCNSETAIDTANFSQAQVDWMEKDLQGVDRSRTPWVIANFHRPMYCHDDETTCERQSGHLRDMAEGVFYEHHVDLVITGHVHSYERTYQVYDNELKSNTYDSSIAPVHIMQGASGNREGIKGSFPPPEELEAWSAVGYPKLGFAIMIVAEKELDWTFYAASVETGPTELDHVLFTRP